MRSATLTPLKRARRAGPFLVLDIESKAGLTQEVGLTRPFLVGVYDGAEFKAYHDKQAACTIDDYWSPGGCVHEALRSVLVDSNRGRIIYAHNGGRFDFLHLLPWFQAEGYDFEVIALSSAVLCIRVRLKTDNKRDKAWTFVDSVRLIPLSLEGACEAFGVPGKLDHDLSMHENDPRWDVYNKQDCVALYGVLRRFHEMVEDHLGGEVGLTLPSCAMKLFRLRYLGRVLDRAPDAHVMARAAYFGGRTEVFCASGKNLYYRDRNSSYPAAMLEPMPVGKAHWLKGKPPSDWFEKRVGFVECDVYVPETLDPPVLPVRHNDRLVFPVGRITGTWDSSELAYAISLGCEVKRWGRSCWFRSEPILREFVLALQQYRDKDRPDWNRALDYVAKILRNAFYGKFGQHPLREMILRDGKRKKDVKDASYIIPQIAAHVPALARIALHRYGRECQAKGGRLYMCDTDAWLTDVWMPEGNGLGEWKAEYADFDGKLCGRFLAPKMYYLWAEDPERIAEIIAKLEKKNDKDSKKALAMLRDSGTISVRAKGLAKECKTRSALEELASGKQIRQPRLEKIGAMARKAFEHGPVMLSVPRRWEPDPGRKRLPQADGSTKPLVLEMW